MAVNDAFVMGAWGKSAGVGDKIFDAGGWYGDYAKALGALRWTAGLWYGYARAAFRADRNNSVAKNVFVEAPKELSVLRQEYVLGQLSESVKQLL